MVQKQNLINLNWKPTQMVVEPIKQTGASFKCQQKGNLWLFNPDSSGILCFFAAKKTKI